MVVAAAEGEEAVAECEEEVEEGGGSCNLSVVNWGNFYEI